MKRKLALLLALVTALSMSACGAKTAESSVADSVNSVTDEQTTSTAGAGETSKPDETTSTTATTPAPETEKPETTTEAITTVQTTTAKPDQTTSTTATTEPQSTTPKPQTTTTASKPEDVQPTSQKKLDVVGLNGYMDLSSGSGITAAATVLGYYGIDIRPLKLEEYAYIYGLGTIEDGVTPSPWDIIVNEPIGPTALYYAKPIVDMINNYLDKNNIIKVKPKDISGASLSDLKKYIDNGKPVIVWGTSNGKPAPDISSWILPNGETFVAQGHMRVYTLIGYTETELILLNDGGAALNVSKDIFTTMYESVYSQAILIE